ncbi:MAG: acyltransferase [Methanobrevibacter sp.]|nr:acyltransferase [Methanobrevibacter sp.]
MEKSKRIFYFDALRALAIACVMLTHIYSLTYYNLRGQYAILSSGWIATQIIGNPFRLGVVLFLMLSGALLLGREEDIHTFLKKRIPRIAIPFIFWNAVLLTVFITSSYFFNLNYIQSFDFQSIVNYIYTSLLGKNTGFGPNWYFWMILGTYLILPIFNKWIKHSSLREVEYFLVIWLVTALFDFTIMKEFPIMLTYFSGPIGFIVLGYYLRYTDRPILKNKKFILLLTLVPALILLINSYVLSSPTHMEYPHRYSLWISLEVAGVFLLFKNAKFNISENGIVKRAITAIAQYSYGIYLFHYSILLLIVRNLQNYNQPIYICILFTLTLISSVLIMSILNRIPYLNQVIGAK